MHGLANFKVFFLFYLVNFVGWTIACNNTLCTVPEEINVQNVAIYYCWTNFKLQTTIFLFLSHTSSSTLNDNYISDAPGLAERWTTDIRTTPHSFVNMFQSRGLYLTTLQTSKEQEITFVI